MAKGNRASDTTALLDEGNAAHKGLRRFLQAMVHMTQPKTVVEIGAGKAASSICMALAGAEYGTRVYAVDPVRRGQKPNIALYMGRRRDRVRMIFKAGEDVRRDDIDGREIDLLFIDAGHTYEETKGTYQKWSGWVRPGGIIILHDVAVEDKGEAYGAWRFWKEIRQVKVMLQMYPGIGIVWPGTGRKPLQEELKKTLSGAGTKKPATGKTETSFSIGETKVSDYAASTEAEFKKAGEADWNGSNEIEPMLEPEIPPEPKKKKPVRGKGGKFVKKSKTEEQDG